MEAGFGWIDPHASPEIKDLWLKQTLPLFAVPVCTIPDCLSLQSFINRIWSLPGHT